MAVNAAEIARARAEAAAFQAEKARQAQGHGPQGAFSGTNVTSGLRRIAEGLGGFAGDAPGMAGGATEWALTQAAKIPYAKEAGLTPEAIETAGGVVEEGGRAGISNLNPLNIIAKLMGMPETQAPTSQDIHEGVSSMIPEGADKYTSYTPQTLGEEAVQTGIGFVPDLLIGNKAKAGAGLADIGKKVLTRIMAPTAAFTGADVVGDNLVENGVISPETATALKVLVTAGTAAGVAPIERALQKKQAVAALGAKPAEMQVVYDALVAEGMTPIEAQAYLTNLGDQSILPDLPGGAMLQQGMKAGTTPGEGKVALTDRLKTRVEGEGDRLSQAKQYSLGPTVNKNAVNKQIRDDLQQIGKEYDPAHAKQTAPADSTSIIADIDTELATVKSPSLRSTLNAIKKTLYAQDAEGVVKTKPGPGQPPEPILSASSEELHAARQAIDDQLYDVKGRPKETLSPTEARTLTKYRKAIDDLIGDVNPDVKAVDTKYAAKAGEKGAFKTGEDALKKGEKAQLPGEFADTWRTLTPEQQARAVQGAGRYVELKMGLTARERGALKTLIGGDINQAKLETMIGPDKANALIEALGREDIWRNTHDKIVEGSRTMNIAEHGDQGGITKGVGTNAMLATAATGSASAGAGAGGMTILRNLTRPSEGLSQQAMERMGKVLAMDPNIVLKALEKYAQAKQGGSIGPGIATGGIAGINDRERDR